MPVLAPLALSLHLERAQLSREGKDGEKDGRETAPLLSTLGTELAPPHQSWPWGKTGMMFLAENQVPRQREGKSLQGRAVPCAPWDEAHGEPFMPQGTQMPSPGGETGEPREGEQPFWSLSPVWRRLLVLEGRAMTATGLGHSTSRPAPSPIR